MNNFSARIKPSPTMIAVLTFMLSTLIISPAFSGPPNSYKSGKPVAAKLWWKIGPSSFYCSCPYRHATQEEKNIRKGNLWVVGFSCGYIPKNPKTEQGKINASTLRIEFEHVVPARMLTESFKCGNREDCRKTSTEFNLAEGDLHNLVPVIGELNVGRRDKEYGLIPNEMREYGACDFEISKSKAEPQESIRGDLARISLYMNDQHTLNLPASYVQLMKDWSASDPVDDAEKCRNSIIAKKMGWGNPYVGKPSKNSTAC